MTICVLSHPHENLAVRFNPAQEGVAARTEQATHAPRCVAVVYEQARFDATDQAPAALRLVHRLNVVGREAVLALEPGSDVLCSGRLGVLPAPFPESFIAASLVRLGVLPSRRIAALLAVRPSLTAVAVASTRKLIDWLRLFALRARLGFHIPSVTVRRDMVRRLDQPCHADLLLVLANGGEDS